MSRRARAYAGATAAKRGELLAQDVSPGLSAWLAGQPDARRHAREAAQEIEDGAEDDAAPTVWLLTTGDGSDGNEWHVQGIHATKVGAVAALAQYQAPQTRSDGSIYIREAQTEEWPLLP